MTPNHDDAVSRRPSSHQCATENNRALRNAADVCNQRNRRSRMPSSHGGGERSKTNLAPRKYTKELQAENARRRRRGREKGGKGANEQENKKQRKEAGLREMYVAFPCNAWQTLLRSSAGGFIVAALAPRDIQAVLIKKERPRSTDGLGPCLAQQCRRRRQRKIKPNKKYSSTKHSPPG